MDMETPPHLDAVILILMDMEMLVPRLVVKMEVLPMGRDTGNLPI
jgi:hypothetical protein